MKKKLCIVYGGHTIESSYSKKAFEYVRQEVSERFDVCGIDFSDLLVNPLLWNELKKYDMVVNLVYGVPGQDGLVASLLEANNIKFKGSSTYTCGLIKDKFLAKTLCSSIGIRTPKSCVITCEKRIQKISDLGIDLPVVVKPRRKGGLSLGITYCETIEEINIAIATAGCYDEKILIEEYISGTEITTCIIVVENEILFLPILEVKKETNLCDYYAKINGEREVIINPNLTYAKKREIENVTRKIFDLFDMEDYGYFDFIMTDTDLYFIEAGAVPGMTSTSNIPLLMNYIGTPLEMLFV